jgi:NAD+ diphosphatase
MPLFAHCPRCRRRGVERDGPKRHHCPDCGWNLFLNPAAGVLVFLRHEGKLLLVERGKDPGAGLWDIPGGFVDPGESAEDAVGREMREELRLRDLAPRYWRSFPSRYSFEGVVYKTCDLFFEVDVTSPFFRVDRTEVRRAKWFDPRRIPWSRLAPGSTRRALKAYLKEGGTHD